MGIGAVAHAVADGVTGLDVLDGGKPAFDIHDGGDAGESAADLGRVDAQGENTGADHVEMGHGKVQESAAVTEVPILDGDVAGLHLLEDAAEAAVLFEGEGFVGFVRHGEVAEHAFQADPFELLDVFNIGEGFGPADAVAAHAGVDFQVDEGGPAEAMADSFQFQGGLDPADAAAEVVVEAMGQFFREPLTEDEDGGLNEVLAESNSFGECGDDQEIGSGLEGDFGDGDSPVAIGFIFDHGGEGDLGWLVAVDDVEILAQLGQVNFHPGGALGDCLGEGLVSGLRRCREARGWLRHRFDSKIRDSGFF